ncbi:hypothetical protein RA263_07845 [Pseudomonas syringae pv. tagetis]|uniref:Uncharacterized protein n=1 Tax=Pseudomonas syringae pv. tagetis TaxID=129140 RepID=A0ABW7NL77_9PSED|nr:hypothetical protein [Pseudomonas syringae group genomosp. 7]UNB65555.1 hypothetical protein MME54_12675 [Pseudomonas syringae pv. helianthi]UNB66448.1 hypothetical protein MME58_14490 [Pseudomonas syringae pv. tagetis]
MSFKTVIIGASIFAGIVSAALWVRSATVTVKIGNENGDDVPWMNIPSGTTGKAKDINVMATAKAQGKWNSLAALTAAITATLQAIATYLPE